MQFRFYNSAVTGPLGYWKKDGMMAKSPHMKVLQMKWKKEFSRGNPSVTVQSMTISVFKILEHSVFRNSDYHWGGAEKDLLCLLNAKGLLDCSFSLCFVCLLASTENTLTVLQFSWEKKPSVFTKSLSKGPGSGLNKEK